MEPGHVFVAEAEEANDLDNIFGNEYDINIEDTDEVVAHVVDRNSLRTVLSIAAN